MEEMMPALEFDAFTFAYPDQEYLFEPLSLSIEEGSFVILEGAIGSGKTTLLKCCKPEVTPTGNARGEIRVFGERASDLTQRETATKIGYVSQSVDAQIVCESVWHEIAFGLENIGMPPALMKRRIAEVAHFFGMESWFHAAIDTLSGGMKQMVNLASVLAIGPRLILLDEPTAQLDPIAEKNFLHALFRINRELDITIVVATHQPEAMRAYATCDLLLHDGTISPIPCIAAGARITQEHLFETETYRHERPMQEKNVVLGLDDVYVRYDPKEAFILRGLDLAIDQGEIRAIIGGNGSGKTTLINTIAGILRPQRGRIASTLRHDQAILPQDPCALFVCDSMIEELREWQSTCAYEEDDIIRIARRFELEGALQQHPYDLSSGQQQLLALAKLLLTKPALLLLDEPTKGLDAHAKALLARNLEALANEGTTIVFATHDLAFAQLLADNTSLIFDGEIVCTEPSVLFFEHNLFYRPLPTLFNEPRS